MPYDGSAGAYDASGSDTAGASSGRRRRQAIPTRSRAIRSEEPTSVTCVSGLLRQRDRHLDDTEAEAVCVDAQLGVEREPLDALQLEERPRRVAPEELEAALRVAPREAGEQAEEER